MPGNLAVDNSAVDGRIRSIRFLPGQPGGNPAINFRGYEDTGFWYDPDTKALKVRFDGTDVYTFDDTGGITTTVTYNYGSEDGLTAFATGGQANATQLSSTKQLHRVGTCATAGDSVKLPPALAGQAHYVHNGGVASMDVFPQTGETINSQAANTQVSVGQKMGFWFFCTTAGAWHAPAAIQYLAPAVGAGAPYYSFAAAADTGINVRTSPNRVMLVASGSEVAAIASGHLDLGSVSTLTWSNSATPGGAGDLILARDAANVLAQRNSTNAQIFRVYNTFTDTSNYERVSLNWSSNVFLISMQNLGTGSARNIGLDGAATADVGLYIAGSQIWRMPGATGHWIPTADVSRDVGGVSTFVKDLYVRRRIGKIATVTYSASMTPDASLGEFQEITANNGTAFTINAPTNPLTGQSMNIKIKNTSGGALGAATWNAVFKMAAWTNPANANSRSIEFYYDGTNWIEFGRTTADVPN